ncbi:MAG TPA: class I SAM-dependent methyltransferase, partial [Planctomycetes bacterium]|nr:class I SAM-dependent methyltransferase [Planctomycetota bacterium]
MIFQPAFAFLATMRFRFLLWHSPPKLFDRLLRLPFYRELLLRQFEHLRLPPKSRVLELGCGPGALGAILEEGKFELIGCDRSQGMLALARKKRGDAYVQLIQGEGGCLPFGDQVFDGVFCANVFHLFRDPLAVLGDLARVLKPGAPLVLAGPEESFGLGTAKRLVKEGGFGAEERAALVLWARLRKAMGSEACMKLV